jgi:UDP-glucose 4-epimerase
VSVLGKSSVAIVGGSGFIGVNLADFLSKKGYKVISISRSNVIKKNYQAYSENLTNTEALVKLTQNCDTIVWLANNSVPASGNNDLEKDFQENTSPLIKYLEAIKALASKKLFIYFSSGGTVYGNNVSNKRINETTKLDPISKYGFSKKITEIYLTEASKESSIKSIIVRPSNVYGPNQNFKNNQGLIGYCLNAIRSNTPFTVFGDGNIIRDYLFIDDLSSAIELIITYQNLISSQCVFNLSAGVGHSINEVIKLIEDITEKKLEIIKKPHRDFDCLYNVLDNSMANKEFNWKPEISLKEGIARTWQFIEK